jgi:hypothetical protein
MGSVKFMVPHNSPLTILARNMSFCAGLPWALMDSTAPKHIVVI